MSRRGIFLISVLFVSLLITMFLGAAVRLAPDSLGAAASLEDEQAALLAAEAGLEYARARLKEDLNWRGGIDGPLFTVNQQDNSMTVVEDHGNVVGLVRSRGGGYAQFRIRFNHHDGAGGADGLDDPDPKNHFDFSEISINNLSHSGETPALRESSGTVVELDQLVPPNQAYLVVEGRSGKAFRDHFLMDPNAPPRRGRLTRKVIVATVEPSFSQELNAAMMAGGNISAQIRPYGPPNSRADGTKIIRPFHVEVSSRAREAGSRARAKGVVEVDGGDPVNFFSRKGEVYTANGTVDANYNPDLTTGQESSGAGFYQLGWDQLGRADASSGDAVDMRAGTYVVWKNQTVHYYDMDFEQYQAHLQANPDDQGTILSEDFREVRNNYPAQGKNSVSMSFAPQEHRVEAELSLARDVAITPTGTAEDFTLITQAGAISGPPDASGNVPGFVKTGPSFRPYQVQVRFRPPRDRQISLSNDADIMLGCRIQGHSGAIISGQDLNIIGVGSLRAATKEEVPDAGINLYARRDINLNGYLAGNDPLVRGTYGSLYLKGVIYAHRDINVTMAPEDGAEFPPGYSFLRSGSLNVTGAMVAYGGDPDDPVNNRPGSGSGGIGLGHGNINIRARWARVYYNSSYLGGLDSTAQPGALETVTWSVY